LPSSRIFGAGGSNDLDTDHATLGPECDLDCVVFGDRVVSVFDAVGYSFGYRENDVIDDVG
jgi:hypothetical protein